VADAFGRVRTYAGYIFAAAALVPLYAFVREPGCLLLLGPLVGFFGHGYFSGFSALSAELFPTAVRAGVQGTIYNLGRGVGALAPLVVGALGSERGLAGGFLLTSGAYFAAGAIALLLPETRGRELDA
jgi:MFS family permease